MKEKQESRAASWRVRERQRLSDSQGASRRFYPFIILFYSGGSLGIKRLIACDARSRCYFSRLRLVHSHWSIKKKKKNNYWTSHNRRSENYIESLLSVSDLMVSQHAPARKLSFIMSGRRLTTHHCHVLFSLLALFFYQLPPPRLAWALGARGGRT